MTPIRAGLLELIVALVVYAGLLCATGWIGANLRRVDGR